ncbi:MAG TPA: ankyrin repeat domain-containing protein [Candidatus Binatia bacterium]|jgi:ankyrin repeat protein
MASPAIFISYRREDSIGHAGRLYDRLAEHFGKERIYRDIDTIQAGENFVEAVRQKVNVSDVVLVLIGPRWLTATDDEGRWRLADENDLVRLEIVTGLERNSRVIPVLLQGASMPRAKDLPGALAGLAQRNAFEIRDSHFDQDVAQLVDALAPTWRQKIGHALRRRPVYGAAALLAVVLLALWVYPKIVFTPERARIEIGQMGLKYDAGTFIDRAKNNDAPVVALFLRAGINPNLKDLNGYSALMWVAAEGNLALAKTLVEKGADINPALAVAARRGKTDMVNFLLDRKPSRQAINEALPAAADKGNTTIMQKLMDSGADIKGEYGGTALMMAAYSANVEALQLLLSHGANINAADSDGETALHYAARATRGSIEIVRILLQQGADVNVRDRDGTTALIKVIQKERSAVALLLLEHNADAGAQTNRQVTAVMAAAANNLASLIQPLIAKGADINGRNDRGETALMWATGAVDNVSKPEVVRELLANGANINAIDNDGWTALMFAAGRGQSDVVRILINRGADPNMKSKDGETALTIASREEKKETIGILREARFAARRK